MAKLDNTTTVGNNLYYQGLGWYGGGTRRRRKQRVRVNGKYNASKLRVLLTIFVFCHQSRKYSGLSLWQLEQMTGLTYFYLKKRLPQFANTLGLWDHRYLDRKWSVARGFPEYTYRLTHYGQRFLEKLGTDVTQAAANELMPLWQKLLGQGA